CKPGGVIIVSCGSKYSFLLKRQDIDTLYKLIVVDEPIRGHEGFDLRGFTVEELKKVYQKNNVELLEISGDSTIIPIMKASDAKIDDHILRKVEKLDEQLLSDYKNKNFCDHIMIAGKNPTH
ncbi:MAG: hypothetical protein ABEK17_03670, partial [Candidatus Aenigmatarchaeota archaeon]